MFPDESACETYLAKLRWPQGFVCPTCNSNVVPWQSSRGRLACPHCRHRTTVSTGTLFDKTRTPLTTWFEAAWHVSTAKNGLSAKTLERTLGTKFRVAWTMLHRFRVAMVNAERKQLSGTVEVDETKHFYVMDQIPSSDNFGFIIDKSVSALCFLTASFKYMDDLK